jgi:glycosyltransferase involved in cell wall biosynthesis
MADPTQDAELHLLHRLWQKMPAGLRRAAWRQATAALAPRPDATPPPASHGVAVCGEWQRASGLGEGARLMQAGLESLGVANWLIDIVPPLPGTPATTASAMPPGGVPLVLHVNAPMLPDALRRLPKGALQGRRIIGYWAWELPVAPPAWHTGARFVHEIWAPSRFTAAALEKLAPGRVRVVPHPVAAAPPRPSHLTRADFGLPDGAFVVLTSFSLASSFARKNPLAAIAAFRHAFAETPQAVLMLKIAHADHYAGDLETLRRAAAGAANIRFDTRTLPQADNHALTACADVVLSLHRSEGFGLVPAEAMMLGKPVVATDWSATAEFIDTETGIPIPYTLVPAIDPRGVFQAPRALWAEADVPAAAAALRLLAGNPEHRMALGARARAAATQRLGTGPLREAVQSLGLATATAASGKAA